MNPGELETFDIEAIKLLPKETQREIFGNITDWNVVYNILETYKETGNEYLKFVLENIKVIDTVNDWEIFRILDENYILFHRLEFVSSGYLTIKEEEIGSKFPNAIDIKIIVSKETTDKVLKENSFDPIIEILKKF